jgi:hypothetical protein
MTYVRPDVPAPVFRDADGSVIAYGERWGADSPPGDSYSVTSHLERFAPLHEVAAALIGHLEDTYDVVVTEDVQFASDIHHVRNDVLRAVRITPNHPDAARLTFVFTSFPSVIMHAGLLQDFLYPICGCDACDETWDRTANELEWQTFAVVAGNYEERIVPGADLEVTMSLAAADETARIGSQSMRVDFPAGSVDLAEVRLRELGGPWVAWPVRTATAG